MGGTRTLALVSSLLALLWFPLVACAGPGGEATRAETPTAAPTPVAATTPEDRSDSGDQPYGGGSGATRPPATVTPAETPTTSPEPTPATGGLVEVEVVNFGFRPEEIRVSPGTTVVWVNTSPTTHTVTDKERRWDSGFLEPGQRFQMTFETPGEYEYWCLLHPDMDGEVVVR
jgi:plastocyanin